jgi:hypothetical protein
MEERESDAFFRSAIALPLLIGKVLPGCYAEINLALLSLSISRGICDVYSSSCTNTKAKSTACQITSR